MRLFDKVKHYAFAAVAVMALGAMVSSGIDVSAKTVNEAKQTEKNMATIGSEIPVYNAADLKINGKSYTKGAIKKKVHTTKHWANPNAYKSYSGSYTEYFDEDIVYDTEAVAKQKVNYKWIGIADYNLNFEKAGTYKVSYATYSYSPSSVHDYTTSSYQNASDEYDYYRISVDGTSMYGQYKVSADRKTATVTPILFKTQHVETYKVVQTTNGLKTIALGSSKMTNKITKKGSKTTTKKTIKNRYLKGKSGKLKLTMNSNYKLTSAFVVTRDANGDIKILPAGNNKNVIYSAGVYSKTNTYDKYVLDAEGNRTYDATTGEAITKEVVTGTSKDKYKYTDIYYGYKNQYTGDYTTYAVGTRNVYVRKRDENGSVIRKKNADGTNMYDADGYAIYETEAVVATVITQEYPVYDWSDGVYKKVIVKTEKVFLPEDLTADKYFSLSGGSGTTYYLNANGNRQSMTSLVWNELSRDGVAFRIMGADGYYEYNTAYDRKFYGDEYTDKGTWVVLNTKTMNPDSYMSNSSYWDYNETTGEYTKWVYKYELDERGDRIPRPAVTDTVDMSGYTYGSYSFKAK